MHQLIICLFARAISSAIPAAAQEPAYPGELKVDPYEQANNNADATHISGQKTFDAFNAKAGIGRIVEDVVGNLETDARTKDIFRAADHLRLRRTIKEQLCYILNDPCDYSGRTMKASHKDQGLQRADFMIMVDMLTDAMDREGVPFWAQKKLLAKLAPMHRLVVER